MLRRMCLPSAGRASLLEAVVFEYRVTKYDPSFRDARGAYLRDEWTSISDIGRSFGGTLLAREDYQRVEDAYVEAALGFLREAKQSALMAVALENHAQHPLGFGVGDVLRLEHVGEVIRHVLREDFWCRLEAPDAFIHFGHDYYMYIGVPTPCPDTKKLAHERGLFVEDQISPSSPSRAPFAARAQNSHRREA